MINANLFDHQVDTVNWLQKVGHGILAHDTGTGKTLSALAYFHHLKTAGFVDRMLVVCPIQLIEDAWINDIEKYTTFTHSSLRKKNYKKADIYLINYESYSKVPEEIKQSCYINLDESSRIKNNRARITRWILTDAHKYAYRTCASATPAPNTELEYWAQVKFCQPDLLPENFYRFRNQFFVLTRGKHEVIEGAVPGSTATDLIKRGFTYKLHPLRAQDFEESLSRCVMTVKKEECLDLPPMTDVIRSVKLTPDELRIYKQMARSALTEIKGTEIAANTALEKVMKLRQATSGFMYDEARQTQPIHDISTKTKELLALVEENKGQPIIVFSSFKHEIREVEHHLSKLGPTVTAYSDSDDTPRNIKAFRNGEAQFIVAHPKTLGHGVTLVNCNLIAFLSLDYSYEMWVQARGRTHRSGQKHPCTNIIFQAKGTVDEIILEAVKKKSGKQELLNKFKRMRV